MAELNRAQQALDHWPGLTLELNDFVQDLSSLGWQDEGPAYLESVALCSACARRCPTAWKLFEEQFLSRVAATIGRVHSDPDFVDEVTQHLREALLSGPHPKLRSYSGKGPLLAWLRVVARREALRLRGNGGPATASVEWLARLEGVDRKPDNLAMAARYAPVLRRALTEVLGTLTTEERNMLRLQLVEGMSPAAISEVFGVHVASVYRRISRCHQRILEAVRSHVRRDLGHVSKSEIGSMFRQAQAELDLSLTRLLAAERSERPAQGHNDR